MKRAPALLAHAAAQQAFVIAELGDTSAAVGQLAEARTLVERRAPRLIRAWLAAAHGEGLAAAGRRDEALKAFDMAQAMLPDDPIDPTLPFLFLEEVHLDRWRGHALAKLGDVEAVSVLENALDKLDPTFTRAETTLHVDLAASLLVMGEDDLSISHSAQAERLALQIGSVRQSVRIGGLRKMGA